VPKKSAHLTRTIIEGMYNYSPYKGARLTYNREYDPQPQIMIDLITKIDIHRAVKALWEREELSKQEIQMLRYVLSDGRLSRRDISHMIQEEEGIYVDQRTISRRLESAYYKISRYLGFEFSDQRLYRMVAKKRGYPYPYILSDEEVESVQQIWERI
jgi:hypothetical protein